MYICPENVQAVLFIASINQTQVVLSWKPYVKP